MQLRTFDFHAPEDTELLNSRFRGVVPAGVQQGFQVENGDAGFVTIRTGVLVTADGVRIEETEDQVNVATIPANNSTESRLDYIVCRHRYLKTLPPPPARYEVLAGNPGANPIAPVVPEDAVILARGRILAGATGYAEIQLVGARVYRNVSFDGRDHRIVSGNEAAWWWDHDRTQGVIRLYLVPPGVFADGNVIDWGAPKFTVSAAGHEELNAEAAARLAADIALQAALDAETAARVAADEAEANTRSAADTALQQTLTNETNARVAKDTDLQVQIDAELATRGADDQELRNALADAKGRAWNENVPANQDMAEMAARLATLETGAGVPGHRTRHEAGGNDELRFDNLADGVNFKKMTDDERTKLAGIEAGAQVNNLTNAQATDLTDGGDSSAHHHDTRYYTKGQADGRYAGAGHNHDARYMREVFNDSRTYNPNTSVNLATFSDAPGLVTVTYNYLDSNGIPQATSYILGQRTTELAVYVTKAGSGSNKTYTLTVANNSSSRLYISIAVWRTD